jgi:predicted nucleic acid-binding protein
MTEVFVDTGAFLAAVHRDDTHHQAAAACFRRLAAAGRRLVTSAHVLDEAVTLVRLRVGHRAAVELGERLQHSRMCRLVDVAEDLRLVAWSLFVRYSDQRFSFTDCTSFAIMHSLGLREAFTFDRRDFQAAGFTAIP